MTPEPLTCTVPEAAALVGVSKWAYYDGIKRGELPGRRIGRRVVVSRAQLERFLERGDWRESA